MAPELNQDVWRGQISFQTTSFTITNNISYVKCALKLVPGLDDGGVPHGIGDGPGTPPRCPVGVRKKFQITNFAMPTKMSSVKYALKSVPFLADAGVLHGNGVGPRTPPRCQGGGPEKISNDQFYYA